MLGQNDSLQLNSEDYLQTIDSINKTFQYQYGKIQLGNNIACIHVPEGYKFLNAGQSNYLLTELWENPPSEVLGMLFREDNHPLSLIPSYAVGITYSKDGYINDEDAKEIDYDELLREMKKDTKNANIERSENGYPTIELIGWASEPFYDEVSKKLHWAKELKFSNSENNTLNYNIRILGRKGYINLNAVGNMETLPQFQQDAEKILASIEFNNGYKYREFNPNIDKLASYGIGGLISGKVLAKAGFFELIEKFWKVILIVTLGIVALFAKKIFGSKI
ncbi:DUF2167 domain-containing protein [Marinifilum caeruleilacunae]|jgi:uncharacterized membrane-anchored protein|nr:DUF2167 domain-containing protein [Marinifilum caeruleilacunae]